MSGAILNVTQASFGELVLANPLPVLVDFWANWCGPCRQLAPVLEQLAGECSGRLAVVKCNVDLEPQLANRYGIGAIPALLLFAGGELVHTIVGAKPKADLLRQLCPFLDGR